MYTRTYARARMYEKYVYKWNISQRRASTNNTTALNEISGRTRINVTKTGIEKKTVLYVLHEHTLMKILAASLREQPRYERGEWKSGGDWERWFNQQKHWPMEMRTTHGTIRQNIWFKTDDPAKRFRKTKSPIAIKIILTMNDNNTMITTLQGFKFVNDTWPFRFYINNIIWKTKFNTKIIKIHGLDYELRYTMDYGLETTTQIHPMTKLWNIFVVFFSGGNYGTVMYSGGEYFQL